MWTDRIVRRMTSHSPIGLLEINRFIITHSFDPVRQDGRSERLAIGAARLFTCESGMRNTVGTGSQRMLLNESVLPGASVSSNWRVEYHHTENSKQILEAAA